jgi:hypothetical protein
MLLIAKFTYSISQRWIKCGYDVLVAWQETWENWSTWRKTSLSATLSTQISWGLAWNRTHVSVVTGQWQITCAMAQNTVMFSMTPELCTLKSLVMMLLHVVRGSWYCRGCSGLKIKRFENRAVHVYRTATLVASLTLWIKPLQASWTTGTTYPSRRR